jgi:hypothetical protein
MRAVLASAAFAWMLTPALSPAPQQQPADTSDILPNMKVELNGAPATIGPVMLDINSYLVPLRSTVTALTGGKATVQFGRPSCSIKVGERTLVKIPLEDEAGYDAELYDISGATDRLVRKVTMNDSPINMKLPSGDEALMIDIETLGSLLGVTVDIDDMSMSLFTPEYWCGLLGLNRRATDGRTFMNAGMLPDMGISPPANPLLFWVRPFAGAFVQIYKLADGKAEPLFAKDRTGAWVTHVHPYDIPAMKPVAARDAARAESEHFGFEGDRFGLYAAIVSTKDLGKDPIAAINSGQAKDGEFCVVGLRQRVTKSPIKFEVYAAVAGDTFASIAQKFKMPVELLLALNGLKQTDKLEPKNKLAVISGFDNDEVEQRLKFSYVDEGLYVVLPSENVATLCAKWRVERDIFYEGNPSIPPGAEVSAGDIVNKLRMKIAPPPPPPPPQPVEFDAVGKLKVAARLTQEPGGGSEVAQLQAGQLVSITHKLPSANQYRVEADGKWGYVPMEAIAIERTEPDPVTTDLPQGDATKVPIIAEALKYRGTPYVWGGASLTQGIDCSHFVQAVHSRVNLPVPPAPVHNQEAIGELAHFKEGVAERGGKVYDFKNPPPLSSLKPGDRLVFIREPYNNRSGSHHTGLYIGRYRDIKYAFVHATRPRVTVGDLRSRYWSIYRYAVKGSARRTLK